MNTFKHIAILLTLLLGQQLQLAHAQLIDQGNMVLDTESNLLWLDLSETDGYSYTGAGADFAMQGWVHATEAQYENLFDSFFSGYVDNTGFGYMTVAPESDLYQRSLQFHEIFGLTHELNSPVAISSTGFYEDKDGILRLGGTGTYVDTSANLLRDYFGVYDRFRDTGTHESGVFLVKAAAPVPEPGTLLLLCVGIAGLGVSYGKGLISF